MHWQGQQLLPTSSYPMENRSSNSRNLGNVGNEQIVDLNCSEVIQQEDDNLKLVQSCENINSLKLFQSCENINNLKLVQSCENINNFKLVQSCENINNLKLVQSCENINNLKLVQSCKNYLWKKRYYISCVLLAVLVVVFFAGYFVGYYVKQSHEDNDHSKMVNQTSTMCLKDEQISFADYFGNDPILDCIDYNRNITVKRCAPVCHKGGHLYECQRHGVINTTIPVENVMRCNDGNPKHYDREIENDKLCFCVPVDFQSHKIYNAGN